MISHDSAHPTHRKFMVESSEHGDRDLGKRSQRDATRPKVPLDLFQPRVAIAENQQRAHVARLQRPNALLCDTIRSRPFVAKREPRQIDGKDHANAWFRAGDMHRMIGA